MDTPILQTNHHPLYKHYQNLLSYPVDSDSFIYPTDSAMSNRQVTTHWISTIETYCVIQWIVMNSGIQ